MIYFLKVQEYLAHILLLLFLQYVRTVYKHAKHQVINVNHDGVKENCGDTFIA